MGMYKENNFECLFVFVFVFSLHVSLKFLYTVSHMCHPWQSSYHTALAKTGLFDSLHHCTTLQIVFLSRISVGMGGIRCKVESS